MNIINKLTVRQLLLNRKRTLVTIIGVIISVAMVTAVASLVVSSLDLFKRQSIATDGEWHVVYKNVNKEQVEDISKHENTKNLILSRDTGYAYLEGSRNKNKPYIYIKEYNSEGFIKFPVVLKEGRFPQNPDEIVISEAILTNAKVDYKVGDTLSLDIGIRRSLIDTDMQMELNQYSSLVRDSEGIKETLETVQTRQYKIVGIIERPVWEPTWSPGYTALSYIDLEFMTPDSGINASVVLKKINGKLFDEAEKLAESIGVERVEFNYDLLRYSGVIRDEEIQGTLYKLSAIIIGIIMIGSISLIYNAFAISVSERSRHLGMMSSVGATKKQKRNSVLFEGFAIGLVSIPLGILSGFAGIGITFFFINPVLKSAMGISEGMRLVIMPSSIIVAVVVSVITILVSTYIPARRASNISAIDAIRQTSDIKITKRQVRTSKLTRIIFGIEGELGLKNLKRNRTKYRATVFSLIISMVLFLTVSYFTSSLEKAFVMTRDGINFDIQISVNTDGAEKEEIVDHILSMDKISESVRIDSIYLFSWVDEDSVADFLKNDIAGFKDGKYQYMINVNALDDKNLEKYAQVAGIDYATLKDADSLNAIVIDTTQFRDYGTKKFVETKSIKTRPGEKLTLVYKNGETEEEIALKEIEIAALTDKLPMGVTSQGASSVINIIVSRETLDKIVKGHEIAEQNLETRIYVNSDTPMKFQEDVESYEEIIGEEKLHAFNVYSYRQQEQQMLLLMKVFVYGFITLISAICTANIFNTISTSIALRKREFAMLKSVGMTPKSFNRMINYESMFYGIKALLYGLPASFGVMYLIYRAMDDSFSFSMVIPWVDVLIMVVAVFAIVGMSMIYSGAKVRKENIIDVLKQEII